MRLSDFIRGNRRPIANEWEAFARGLPPAAAMSRLQLTDHIDEILTFIADDIETSQTRVQQVEKSQGKDDADVAGLDTAAQIHASLRHENGFDIVEMISEYRALRATVIKLWTQAKDVLDRQDAVDIGRFNEAIDQTLAESVSRFSQDVDKAKDLLLGVLGHDIRSPVSAIEMAADLIPRAGDMNAKQLKMIEQIRVSAVRVRHIVGDLLDLAKAGLGSDLPVVRTSCSLSRLCASIVGEIRLQNPDREILLLERGDVRGAWDEVRLGQVVSNLLSNAIQYGACGTPITVTLGQGIREATLEVRNEGVPIPPAHLQTIFRSLTSIPAAPDGKSAANVNLGIGLFISREIVVAHGGSIDVVSTAEKGTTFIVKLPNGLPDIELC
ncbi:MAG: HAMP domain-containing histidine kinase [Asticcacaulis sp.]|nr:HAMP domain-containing histidine kinase [Asticcacaulis sp.]